MQKTLMISVSALFFLSSAVANPLEIERYGFSLTQECLQKGELNECPTEQLQKISAKNPLLLYSADQYVENDWHSWGLTYNQHEQKTYILDLSHIKQSTIESLGFRGNILVQGVLQADQITLKVTHISYKPLSVGLGKGWM